MANTDVVNEANQSSGAIRIQTGRTTSEVAQTRSRKSATGTDAASVSGSTVSSAGQDGADFANTEFADCPSVSRNDRLATWFEVWRASMRRWVASRSSVQAADLDDVAQEVFVRLLRYSDDALIEHPQSYLFRIAINVVNEWRERSRNSLPHDDTWLADLQIERDDEPESAVENTLVSAQVRSAVARLPKRQREVLLLHIKDDLTYKQIAKQLKLTPRVVRRDIARAYAQLRSELHAVDLDDSEAEDTTNGKRAPESRGSYLDLATVRSPRA
jgi:RNA polymerase sigma factor (sigma-70 family)